MVERHEVGLLWSDFARTRSSEVREMLISQHAHLARRTVERLQISAWGCVSREDLLGHAVIGLIDAVDRFDPRNGACFEAFAAPRIRGAVLDALRKLDWVPRSIRAEETRLAAAFERLEARLGRSASDQELAAELGVSRSELERLLTSVARSSVTSLDDLVAGMQDTTRGDLVAGDGRHDPQAREERRQAKHRLTEAIQSLPEREQLLISLYYYEELTLREIGQVLEVSEQRVSQLHARAMMRLSHKLTRNTELVAALAA